MIMVCLLGLVGYYMINGLEFMVGLGHPLGWEQQSFCSAMVSQIAY